MVPDARRLKDALLLAFVVGLLLTGGEPKAVNALPGFSDHTGPSELRVSSLERIDAGCRDAVSNYASGSGGGGNHTRVSFVATGDPDADLSAWVERTSPPGADLSTFRVHVESRGDGEVASNASCELGVQYRIETTATGGSPEGILPDAHGVEILWLENGEYAGCSGSYTSPLRGRCPHLYQQADDRDLTWANATTDQSI
ncbi:MULTISPECIES: hypothetical protein [Halorussus]|uniref:hypothetical protein n=1 Tax=Halorussus TaxID=1070314 RepID=UPI000E217F22|nr:MULTISPECIES: hypothetical protein [Halorussus]NHN58874.1 hypothetical protein [Halorussus sp. JP-T4]